VSEGIVLRLAENETPEALLAAALDVRRAGLEHLVDAEVSPEEVKALGMAGDLLEVERALLFRKALADPESLERAFDGGRARRARIVDAFLERVAREGEHGAA
jgi:hypothetical protein